jgi:uncharacterized membrane protein
MEHDPHEAANHGAIEAAHGRTSLLITSLLLGIGLMGAMDTILFHQFLQWHNFYIHTDQYWRIVSDGFIHTVTTTLLFVGAIRLWRHRRLLVRTGPYQLAGAILLGMGGFQLYDGTINHMVLQLHPVREGVANQLPYDFAWNATALALLVVGWIIWRRHG